MWEQRIQANTEFYGWLEEEINKYTSIGWAPTGGITVIKPMFIQAVYR